MTAVGAKVLGSEQEDVGFITLGYTRNILDTIHVSWADPNKTRETVTVASERRIVFNDLNGMERLRIFRKGMRRTEEPSNFAECVKMTSSSSTSDVTEPLKEQCRYFLECVSTDALPINDGRNGCDILKVLEAVDQSIQMNSAKTSIGGSSVHDVFAAA